MAEYVSKPLNKEEVDEVRELFQIYDLDDCGQVPVDELGAMITVLGWDPTCQQIDGLIGQLKLHCTTKSFLLCSFLNFFFFKIINTSLVNSF